MFAVKMDKVLLEYREKIQYALDYLFSVLGYPYRVVEEEGYIEAGEILFLYTADPQLIAKHLDSNPRGFAICILHDPLHYDYGKLSSEDFDKYIHTLNIGYKLPYICSREIVEPISRSMDKKHSQFYVGEFHFDLIGNIFFHLSGAEEEIFKNRDGHNRYLWQESPFRKYYQQPFLTGLINIVELFLTEGETYIQNALIKVPLWPGNRQYAAALSHSVDKLEKWTVRRFFNGLLDLVSNIHRVSYHWRNIWSFIRFLFRNWEPYWNFDLVSRIEKKLGFVSTFFFGARRDNRYDIDYELTEADLIKQKRELLEKGHELGLLSYYDSLGTDDYKERVKELEAFAGMRINGVRQNYYRNQPNRNSVYYLNGGLNWDSSRGMTDMRGFINGIGYPYQLADESWQKRTVLEIPVNFCDKSLNIGQSNLSESQTKEEMRSIIEQARKFQGMAVFDFSLMNFEEIPYLAGFYEETLKKLRDDPSVWKTSLGNIFNWIQQRGSIKIIYQGSKVILQFGACFDELTLFIKGYWQVVEIEGRVVTEEVQEELDIFSENTWWRIGKAEIQIIGRMLKLRKIQAGSKIELEVEKIGK
ncbi:MAG: hypothetical protein K9N06_04420 [Candidatus Cloacimonetes bacterium]|nr:hypothetical protein [Candidatus Cloacimonadota bacterium]